MDSFIYLLAILPFSLSIPYTSEPCGGRTRISIDCHSFAHCVDGKWTVTLCPNGTSYDSKKEECLAGGHCRHRRANEQPSRRHVQTIGRVGVQTLTGRDHRGFQTTTISYYDSNGQSFRFTIEGPPPAPQNEMIAWVQQNHHRYKTTPIPYQDVVVGARRHVDTETLIGPGGTYTTLYYYNSKGPNFKFTIQGPPPVSNNEIIEWVEKNHHRYEKTPIANPDSDGSVPRPAPPPQTNTVTYPVTQKPPTPVAPVTYPTRPYYTRNTPKPTTTAIPPGGHIITLTLNEILPQVCGIYTNDKIIDGKEEPIEKVPWQVAIVRSETRDLVCGGSIITFRHVLTASHCFVKTQVIYDSQQNKQEIKKKTNEDELRIYAGHRTLATPQLDIALQQIITHTHYSSSHKRNDIALVLIQGTFEFSSVVYPICLPTAKDVYNEGKTCRVSGWGRTKEDDPNSGSANVFVATLKIVNEAQCRIQNAQLIKDGMFCAGDYDKGGADTCNGDSGGPCACDVSSKKKGVRAMLFGITSWGIGCGQRHRPGVYTKVAKYITWIHKYLQISIGGSDKAETATEDEDIGKDDDEDEEDPAAGADPDADVV